MNAIGQARPRPRGCVSASRLVFAAALASCAGTASADQAIGFGREATGGAGGPICPVRDEASLRACVAGPAPAIVVVEAPLTIDPGLRRIEVGSNKTIDGRGELTIAHDWIGLDLAGSRNVIIRRVRFRGAGVNPFPEKGQNCAHPSRPADLNGCGVSIQISGPARDIWIDHNTFETCGNKCLDAWGRPPAAGGEVSAPDMLTISNNIFEDSYFAILFGVDERIPASQLPREPGRATLYGNLFERIFRRSPRAQADYRLHVFNNLIVDFGGQGSCSGETFGWGPAASTGAQVLLENNVIEAWPQPGSCKEAASVLGTERGPTADRGPGYMQARGNALLNGATLRAGDRVFSPNYPYSLMATDQVARHVRANAGASA